MASKKVAESTLYHLSPKGFWKKFRDATVVNPEISSGLPIANVNRYPQPGSRPEKYSPPASMASDPAQNPYWKRDVRRAYPRLSVITQQELSDLLLQQPENTAVSAPKSDNTSAVKSEIVPKENVELSDAITIVASQRKLYTESKLPPTLPTPYKRWIPELAPDAPHDPSSYFPMSLYK